MSLAQISNALEGIQSLINISRSERIDLEDVNSLMNAFSPLMQEEESVNGAPILQQLREYVRNPARPIQPIHKYRMPFGKYKGITVDELPSQYIENLAGGLKKESKLKNVLEIEIKKRHSERINKIFASGRLGSKSNVFGNVIREHIHRTQELERTASTGGR